MFDEMIQSESTRKIANVEVKCPLPYISVLTGGGDRPYALGLASALMVEGVDFDFVASDELDSPELHQSPNVQFLNFRGNQDRSAGALKKAWRVLRYYFRLIWYAATTGSEIFHILWNNKFESFDRTVLLCYYRMLGKRIVLTVHNVNTAERDGKDSWWNRLTLRCYYRLAHQCLVHTEKMRGALIREFDVPARNVTVIPFGINNTLLDSPLSSPEAKAMLGLELSQKIILFFGTIAPYKGLEHLVAALEHLKRDGGNYRLIVAGIPKGCPDYWARIENEIERLGVREELVLRIKHIPDDEVEIYFKAADVLALPYLHIFQSGVLVLSYRFGLPLVATDVGSIKEDVQEGKTGFMCRPNDPRDLATVLERYFASSLYENLEQERTHIREFAEERFSWAKAASTTVAIYHRLAAR